MTNHIVGGTVSLAEIVSPLAPSLSGYTFEGCEIVGPGVVILNELGEMHDNKLSSEMFWVLEEGRGYLGGIAMDGATFLGCTFTNVGFAGAREVVDAFFHAAR